MERRSRSGRATLLNWERRVSFSQKHAAAYCGERAVAEKTATKIDTQISQGDGTLSSRIKMRKNYFLRYLLAHPPFAILAVLGIVSILARLYLLLR